MDSQIRATSVNQPSCAMASNTFLGRGNPLDVAGCVLWVEGAHITLGFSTSGNKLVGSIAHKLSFVGVTPLHGVERRLCQPLFWPSCNPPQKTLILRCVPIPRSPTSTLTIVRVYSLCLENLEEQWHVDDFPSSRWWEGFVLAGK